MAWQALLALFVCVSFVEGLSMSHIFAFAPLYLQGMGVPPAEVPAWIGLLSAGSFVLGLPLVPFWGVWAERYGRRLVIARSAYVEALVLLFVGLSRTPVELVASRLLSGLQLGNTGVMYAALTSLVPRERLGLALGMIGAGSTLGAAGGPALGGLLADAVGLRTLYLVDAGLSLVSGLAVSLLFREPRRSAAPTTGAWREALDALRGVVNVRVVRTVFVMYTMLFVARQMATPFLPLQVQALFTGDNLATTIGLVVGGGALIGVLVSPAAGALGDRVGYTRVLAGGAVVGVVGALALAVAPSLPVLALAVLLFSAGLTAVGAMCVALLATVTSEARRSSTLNLALLPLYAGGILGPALGAAVASLGVRATFVAAAAPMLVSLVLTRRVSVRR